MKNAWLRSFAVGLLMAACVAAFASTVNKPAPKPAKPLPRLVDVGANYCLPCKVLEPIMKDLAREYKGRLTVVLINASKQPEEAKKYKTDTYPTLIFFNASGKEAYRHVGFLSKAQIVAEFKSLGIRLSK